MQYNGVLLTYDSTVKYTSITIIQILIDYDGHFVAGEGAGGLQFRTAVGEEFVFCI